MKRLLSILLLSLVGLAGGSYYAVSSLRSTIAKKSFSVQNGCWTVSKNMDLVDPHQRALIAMAGLFALQSSEVLYFVASKDSDGNPLSSQNDYILEGPAPNARYWSYTLYGHDFFLIDNPKNIYGYNMDNIQYINESQDPEMPSNTLGNHQIVLSNQEKEQNWLPSGNEEQIYINLRMYNPAPEVYNNLETIPLPKIKRIP